MDNSMISNLLLHYIPSLQNLSGGVINQILHLCYDLMMLTHSE